MPIGEFGELSNDGQLGSQTYHLRRLRTRRPFSVQTTAQAPSNLISNGQFTNTDSAGTQQHGSEAGAATAATLSLDQSPYQRRSPAD
jgi:hypothetical protein